MKVPFIASTGSEHVDDVSQIKLQNWYPHMPQNSKSDLVLYPTPGLTLWKQVRASGPVRGMIEFNDELYVVIYNTFYKVSQGGATVALGTLSTNTGVVSMAHNGAANGGQIVIADGVQMKLFTLSGSSFANPANGSPPNTATHVDFIDGYFVANNPAVTGRFALSNLYDGDTWTATDVATAERRPDKLQAVVVSNTTLWLVGSKTTEAWLNLGNLDFPFSNAQGGYMQWGTIAPYSVIDVNGVVFFLTQTDEGIGQVAMLSGVGEPTIISTSSISSEITELTSLEDAYAFSYQYKQHYFYVLTFPTDGRTFVYDMATQMWHEWSTKSTGNHIGYNHIYIYGKHLVGSSTTGKIYEMDWDTFTDAGEQITRICRTPSMHNDDVPLAHNAVMLDMKEGAGNASIANPQVHLRWRDNNGAWSSTYSREVGSAGDTQKRIVFRRLGRSFERVYEVKVTDPFNAILVQAYAEVKPYSREIR